MSISRLNGTLPLIYMLLILFACSGRLESEKDLPDSIQYTHPEVIEEILLKYEPLRPEEGLVPDPQTAIKIAEAVWYPIWGEKVYNYRPYSAKLLGDTVWVVSKSFKVNDTLFRIGGNSPIAVIRKADGQILRLFLLRGE